MVAVLTVIAAHSPKSPLGTQVRVPSGSGRTVRSRRPARRRPRTRPGMAPMGSSEVPMSSDPLALDSETMRKMGYEVIDLLVRRIHELADGPVLQTASRTEMAERIDEPAPESPSDFGELLGRLDRDVLPFVGHFDHPRFFGYVPGAGTWPGALGDLIAAAANIDAGAWREAAGPSQIELTVLEWFRGWIGYPHDAAGVLVSGGSAANLTAIATAREALVGPMSSRIVAYTSDQSHSSLARAARQLGFRPDQIRVMPSDDAGRMH